MSENSTEKFYQKGWFWVAVGVVGIIIIALNSNSQLQKASVVASNQTSEANNTATTSAPTQQAFKIGDKVKFGDYNLTVTSAQDCTAKYMKPQTGNKYVAIDVTQENSGTESQSYNPFDFKLQDDKAYSYEIAGVECKSPAFTSGDLAQGKKVRGFLVFEIPKDNKATELVFKPNMFNTDQISINLQ